MNISEIVSILINKRGLYNITLPFKDQNNKPIPTEKIVSDLIADTTIPIYSEYVPWIREGDINLANLKCVDQKNSIYLLPVYLTTTPVMYVSDVSFPVQNNRGSFGDVAPTFGVNRSVQGVITAQSYMMLAGQMRAEPTFEYLGFNKIKLYGFPKTMLHFKVACRHMPNCESIEEGCRKSFLDLADLDLKVYLYNNLKYYDKIQTAFGTIDLKTDEYQNAESERKDMLEKWDETFHLDQIDWIDFM